MKKKKNKGKRLFIRKKRNLSTNKRKIRYFEEFSKVFDWFFTHKKHLHLKKSLSSFLKRFHFSGMHKIQNYIKIFGFNKSYKVNIYKHKSVLPIKFIHKFKLNKKKKLKKKIKIKSFKILKRIYHSNFRYFRNIKKKKLKNIRLKKLLCLHFSYRHLMLLPVRGQRTKTNAKTRKDFMIL